MTSIGDNVFYGCYGLTKVNFSNSLKNIGHGAFYGCRNLLSVTLPDSVISIGYDAFKNCEGLTSVTLPNTLQTIGAAAFFNCTSLKSITIPDSITTIQGSTFFWCTGLTSITIPNSVTSLGEEAFYGCTGLTSITLSNQLSIIGKEAFQNCTGLTALDLPNSMKIIGDYAFSRCSGLTSVKIPNSVTSIGGVAFSGCTGLTSVNIPNSLTDIDYNTFYNCTGLTSIDIPNSVTSIGSSAFNGCTGLTSVDIPNSVTSIKSQAFYGCTGLTSVDIPNSVTNIGGTWYLDKGAFQGCTNLTKVSISNSIKYLGDNTFAGCNSLSSVTCKAVVPPSNDNDNAFSIDKSKVTLYVPLKSEEAYRSADIWKKFNIKTFSTEVSSVMISEKKLDLSIGEHAKLNAVAGPDYADNTVTKWTSSNPSVAYVDENGSVIAKSAGVAQITVNSTDGTNLTDTCIVTVKNAYLVERDTKPSEYGDVIYVENAEGHAGKSVTLSLRMKHYMQVSGFQVNMYLPKGFTISKVSRGDGIKTMDEDEEYVYTFKNSEKEDGSRFLLCYSVTNTAMPEGDIEVAKITVDIPEDALAGNCPIILKAGEMAFSSTNKIVDYVKSSLTVKDFYVGDANSDGIVSVADITAISDFLLGNKSDVFNENAADANGDGTVSVADITTLADSLLGNAPTRTKAVVIETVEE